MTAYNRDKHIATAIESVLASTFTDFELIIVDDGSSDQTQEIARSYETKDSRIRVHVNETNLGDYPNRNQAASLARGKWLKYVDSDDFIYPNGLEVLVRMMEQFPEAGYGLCSIRQMEEGPFPICLKPIEAYRQHYFRASIFHKAPLSAIIRREAWQSVDGFSGEDMIGDFDMWHRLSYSHDVVLMPLGIVWYRIHPEQLTADSRRDPITSHLQHMNVVKRHLRFESNPLTPREIETLANRYRKQNQRMAIRRMFSGDLNGYRQLSLESVEFKKIGKACKK